MRRPGVALAVLAALARETLLVRPGEWLDGFRLADLVKTVYGSASSLIHNPVGCSPIWPALVLTRRTFLAMVCDLRAWLRCVASFSRDFLSQLKALELVSTERMPTRSCGGRRE